MLESLEQSNIKRMATEQKEEKSETLTLFDYRRNVTDEDWKAMDRERDRVSQFGVEDTVKYLKLQINFRRIKPDKVRKSYQSMDNKIKERLKAIKPHKQFDFIADNYEFHEFNDETLKILGQQVALDVPKLKEELTSMVNRNSPAEIIRFLDAAKRLKLDELVEAGKNQQSSLYKFVEEYEFEGEEPAKFAEYAAKLKTIWPERKIKLDNQTIRGLQSLLALLKKEKLWVDFAELAGNMAQLTEKAEDSDLGQSIPAMPEERNF